MDHVQQLRNLKDFLLVYNRMTEVCFQRCTTNFNYRALTMDEERCVDSCAGKLIRSNHRLMGTYVQLMPKMVQRRMDELESKAAELASSEAQANNAGIEQAVVPTVPDSAAADVPIGNMSPDVPAPISVLTQPPPALVPEATRTVPDPSSAPAADMPVMNGPSLTNGAGSGAPLLGPPQAVPEVSGAVGLVPGTSESLGIFPETKAAVPVVVEGPSTPMSIPSVTDISQGSFLSASGEQAISSTLELPSTAPPTLSVTAPSIESNVLVSDMTKATIDATAPALVPALKPGHLTSGVPETSSATSPSAGPQSSS